MKPSQAFPPSRRLHYPREYRRFFNGSDVFKLGECTVFRIPNTLGHFRLGITIKARGRSLDRNRIKRQLREFFRLNEERLGSYDYNVLIPGHRKIAFPFHQQLRQRLERSFFHVLSRR